MQADLAEVAERLASSRDPMEVVADWIEKVGSDERVHAKSVPAT
jgi:hypothetical protein